MTSSDGHYNELLDDERFAKTPPDTPRRQGKAVLGLAVPLGRTAKLPTSAGLTQAKKACRGREMCGADLAPSAFSIIWPALNRRPAGGPHSAIGGRPFTDQPLHNLSGRPSSRRSAGLPRINGSPGV